jgi:hypothetical protein
VGNQPWLNTPGTAQQQAEAAIVNPQSTANAGSPSTQSYDALMAKLQQDMAKVQAGIAPQAPVQPQTVQVQPQAPQINYTNSTGPGFSLGTQTL